MRSSTIEVREQLMRLKREKLKLEAPTSFSRFLGYSNPKYELEWFHKLIADHCQMLLEGKIKNLMVFMPPQHGKSEIISRNFPAWALGQNPDLKIVGCSYSSDLAQQFSRSIQRTIDSKEYQAIFPETYLNGSLFEECRSLRDGRTSRILQGGRRRRFFDRYTRRYCDHRRPGERCERGKFHHLPTEGVGLV